MPNKENNSDNTENIFKEFSKENPQNIVNEENIKPLLNEDDFNDIITQGNQELNIKKTKVENYTSKKKFVSSIIKKEDAKDIKEFVTSDFSSGIPLSNTSQKKFKDETYLNISTERYNEDFQDLDIFSKNSNDKTPKQNIEINPESANDTFIDYVKYPKISGKNKNQSCGNILPKEDISKKKESIEISDTPNFTKFQQSNSVIEINRNEDGDMISIVVYCHCGEKTVIKFDYYDPDDFDESDSIENLTDIQNDKIEIQAIKVEDNPKIDNTAINSEN